MSPDVEGLDPIGIVDDASVSQAREAARRAGRSVGLPETARESLVVAASELARNQLVHAQWGRVFVRCISRAGVAGVEVIAIDRGPGIAEPARAMRERVRSPVGLGHGLGGAARLSDELDLDVRTGEGTHIRARKLAGPVAYRSELAILARPAEGEIVCGDDATFARLGDDRVLLALLDGVGHGPQARDASRAAVEVLHRRPDGAPEELLRECDETLAATRGAAMSVLRFDPRARSFEHACLGDITTRIARLPRGEHRFACRAGIVGRRVPFEKKVRTERAAKRERDVLIAHTDGIRADWELPPELALQHPLVTADYLLHHCARADDDALVAVFR